jgi:hypothetical protein
MNPQATQTALQAKKQIPNQSSHQCYARTGLESLERFDLKRVVKVNRKERKEHKDKGMWLISLGFRLTH